MIKGGALKRMVIYTDAVAPSNGVRTKHEIRMTEVQSEERQENRRSRIDRRFVVFQHKWKYFNSVLETSVSRSDFMSVLADIEYLAVKASYGSRLQQSRYRCTPALRHPTGDSQSAGIKE